MNRKIAPNISNKFNLLSRFPKSNNSIYRIDSEDEVFKLEIVFPNAGYSQCEDRIHSLYASDLILSGTPSHTAHDISNSLDLQGSFVFKSCDFYSSSITLYGINESISKCLPIIKDSIENCDYNLNEVSVHKNKKSSELNINLGRTAFLANRSINQKILGINHPFARATHLEDISNVSPIDLIAYKDSAYVNPYYIFTGSKNIQVENYLNGLIESTKNLVKENIADQIAESSELPDFIEKKNSTQNSIRLGKILPSRSHKDYFKISMFNLILGGYFGSRLMKNIREEKGLTYGIHSNITPFKDYSLFKISSECNSALTDKVLEEIRHEIVKLQTEIVGSEEFDIARNYMIGLMIRNFDGAYSISERLKTFLDLDSKENYYESFFQSLLTTSREDIIEIANNYFDINTLKHCVSGEH
jgi:zinc protease